MLLNPFPIQWLALLAYLILRVITGLVLFLLARRHFLHRHTLATTFTLSWWPYGRLSVYLLVVAELITAAMLTLGVYTQIAALLVAVMALKLFFFTQFRFHPLLPSPLFSLLLLGVALCLFITGAGALAFDLPI